MDPAPLPPERRRFPAKLVLGIFLVLVILIVVWLFTTDNKPASMPTSGTPRTVGDIIARVEGSAREYALTIEKVNSELKITNTDELVGLRVPDDWEVSKELLKGKHNVKILSAHKYQLVDTNQAPFDGTDLDIIKLQNSENLSLADWIAAQTTLKDAQKIMLGSFDAYVMSHKDEAGSGAPSGPWIFEKSQVQSFYVKGRGSVSIYHVRCASGGDRYEEYARQCREMLVKSLEIP